MAEHSGGFGLFLIILLVNLVNSNIPESRLCVDHQCKETISIAVVKLPFTAGNEQEINLQPGAQVRVTSKNANQDHTYWGGEINGVAGFFPFSHVEELKVFAQPKIVTSSLEKSDDQFMADAYEAYQKSMHQQQAGNNNDVEVTEIPVIDPSPTDSEVLEEEDEGEEGDDEYEEGEEDEEDAEGDEEGDDEGEEGDETEAAEVESTESVEPKVVEANTEQQPPQEQPQDANQAVTPSTTGPTDGGGLLSSIGNMFGGMFGGGKETPQPAVQEGNTEQQPETIENNEPVIPETREGATIPEQEAAINHEQETDPTEIPEGSEEGVVDDAMRTIQADQLARIRNNFLRRRVHSPNPPAENAQVGDIDEINKQLEKKYERMKDPPQYRGPPKIAELNTDGSQPNDPNINQVLNEAPNINLLQEEEIQKQREAEMRLFQQEQEAQKLLLRQAQDQALKEEQEKFEAERKGMEEERARQDQLELAKKQDEDLQRLKAEQMKKQFEEHEKLRLEQEERRKAEETRMKEVQEREMKLQMEQLQKAQEEERLMLEEEQRKKEMQKKQEEELKKKQEEEAKRKQQEELEELKRKAEIEMQEALKKKEEEELKQKQELELRLQREEAIRKENAEEIEKQKRALERRLQAEAEMQRQRLVHEEQLKRQQHIAREKQLRELELELAKAKQPDQPPPLSATQALGSPPSTPFNLGAGAENGDFPQEVLGDASLPHASTIAVAGDQLASGELEASDLTSPTFGQTQPSVNKPETNTPLPNQHLEPTPVHPASAVPLPTTPDVQQETKPEVKPIEISAQPTEMIQPSTPTPSDGIRPSVLLSVPPTETTMDASHLNPGTLPADEEVVDEEGTEEEEEDGGEEGDEEYEYEEGDEEELEEDAGEGVEETIVDTPENTVPEANAQGHNPSTVPGEEVAKEEPANEVPQEIDPTPTSLSEDMEQTITGEDGLKSVVFDGTTLALDDPPATADYANLEMSSDILSSPSVQAPNMGATPPLRDIPAPSSLAVDPNALPTVEFEVVDIPVTHNIAVDSATQNAVTPSELPGGAAAQGEKQVLEEGHTEININDTHAPAPSENIADIPIPDRHQYQGEDPYTSIDFVSRRPLQSRTIDDVTMEQPNPDLAQGFEAEEEEKRTEPDGQEEVLNVSGEEQVTPPGEEQVTPPPSMEPEEVPPVFEEVTIDPTPPTIEEEAVVTPALEAEPEQQKTGYFRSLVGLVDYILQWFDPVLDTILGLMPSSVTDFLAHEPFGLSKPRAAILSVLTSLVLGVLTFTTCVGACWSRNAKDPLAKVAKLQDDLFVNNKERDELQQMVDKLKKEVQTVGRRSAMSEDDIASRDQEIQTMQYHNAAMKQNVETLEKEVQRLNDVQTMNSNAITEKDSQLEQLMYQNSQLQEQYNTASAQLQEAWQVMTEAQTRAAELQVQHDQITEEVTILTESKDQLQLEVAGWSEKVREQDDEIELLKDQQLEKDKLIAFKDNELEVMRDCFTQLKAMDAMAHTEEDDKVDGTGEPIETEERDEVIGADEEVQAKIKSMMDVSKVNAQLKEVTEERDKLQQKVDIEVEARKEMEDQMQSLHVEMNELKRGHQQAEQQSKEATTKLNVLSSYFKEKEVELQHSLGEQVVRQKESQETLMTADEKTQKMEHEMASYRKQVEDLKKEIDNVERDFRTQIAANEKKAHESWLAARQAERNLKESKNEAALLRQKLVEVESRKELNDPIGLIRPLPTRGMPPPGVGPMPPPGMPLPGPPPLGLLPGERPMSRGSGIPPSPHMRDDDFMPPPPRGRPPPMMDRDRLPPGGRLSPPGGWGPGGRGRSPPHFNERSPPPFDRRSPPPFDRRGPPPPPHDRRSPPPMFRGPPPPDRRGPPPPGYRSPNDSYRRTPPHGRPYPPDHTPPPEFRKGGLDPRDYRMKDPRTSSPYDRPGSSASRSADLPPPPRSQNYNI